MQIKKFSALWENLNVTRAIPKLCSFVFITMYFVKNDEIIFNELYCKRIVNHSLKMKS